MVVMKVMMACAMLPRYWKQMAAQDSLDAGSDESDDGSDQMAQFEWSDGSVWMVQMRAQKMRIQMAQFEWSDGSVWIVWMLIPMKVMMV